MFPGGRSRYPYQNSLQDPDNGGGFYPDRMYSHTPGALRGDSRYNHVFGTSSRNWSYTDNGRYGRFEPYDRRGPRRLRRGWWE
ncbi:hypothetical protein GT037_003150 [Alternaria burnsii]|uniref:Uncharacterized protein n=1 Tax=Alternaria burnsii TaxID=1187904 RepID=A0A8H7EGU4_9PLEO|nr:uncharacterized protein GT037_003150 [Alternaria burnsii]KAF7679402.1 hypothetical protein GT037_003150 [Alternaria burnsii]